MSFIHVLEKESLMLMKHRRDRMLTQIVACVVLSISSLAACTQNGVSQKFASVELPANRVANKGDHAKRQRASINFRQFVIDEIGIPIGRSEYRSQAGAVNLPDIGCGLGTNDVSSQSCRIDLKSASVLSRMTATRQSNVEPEIVKQLAGR